MPRRGRESWLGLMWEVEVLRRAAAFGRSHEQHVTLSEGGARATLSGVSDVKDYAAASTVVMRAGRHYAKFTMEAFPTDDKTEPMFGVIRPAWDVEGGQNPHEADGHFFYDTASGCCCNNEIWQESWEGMQAAFEEGDCIGLLLDLDKGSLTVYKNDKRLGVMQTGLSGEYCWALSLYASIYGARPSLRIEAAALPAEETKIAVD